MNLLTLLLRLPLLPLQGFLRVGELIDEEVQHELRDPARLRHDLEQIQQALESGQISEEEAACITSSSSCHWVAGPSVDVQARWQPRARRHVRSARTW